MLSNPALTTFATIVAIERVLDTTASVATRRFSAVTDLNVTVGSSKTRRAKACVRALPRIQTGATVLAWPTICAVVEILVAKQTTPAFVATTLPRRLTCSMHTARILFAFAAQFSFPA